MMFATAGMLLMGLRYQSGDRASIVATRSREGAHASGWTNPAAVTGPAVKP
jgi:hypothetical protein